MLTLTEISHTLNAAYNRMDRWTDCKDDDYPEIPQVNVNKIAKNLGFHRTPHVSRYNAPAYSFPATREYGYQDNLVHVEIWLLHEFAHILSQDNPIFGHMLQREVEAELTALLVTEHYGADISPCVNYIASYFYKGARMNKIDIVKCVLQAKTLIEANER
jgi:hypothetical protein